MPQTSHLAISDLSFVAFPGDYPGEGRANGALLTGITALQALAITGGTMAVDVAALTRESASRQSA